MSERAMISIVVGLFLCGSVRADLVVDSTFDFQDRPLISASSDLESQITDTTVEVHPMSITGYGSLHVSSMSRYDLDEPAQPVQTVSDSGQSSFSLCLSALVGLGLYGSMHNIKRLSLGFVPQWYHNNGPFQVGHSIAVDLDSSCPAPVCCFVQPIHGAADIALQRQFKTVVSLWRTSQFPPDLLATRGPPWS